MTWRRGSVQGHVRSTESQLLVGLSLNFHMSDRAGSCQPKSPRQLWAWTEGNQREADQVGLKQCPSPGGFERETGSDPQRSPRQRDGFGGHECGGSGRFQSEIGCGRPFDLRWQMSCRSVASI